MSVEKNPLLGLDVYKMGHMEQYVPGCNKVYSHLVARSDKHFKDVLYYGQQYILKKYLSNFITENNIDEHLRYKKHILGSEGKNSRKQLMDLLKLGYFPLHIKSVPEGTVIPTKQVLQTIVSTHDDFYWLPGFFESLILKVWFPTTVASCVYKYRKLVEEKYNLVDLENHFKKDYVIHDFGYRSDSSEESAAISGSAFLLSFYGSDTVSSIPFILDFYNGTLEENIMKSVPASEHSVMCSFGREDELSAFENMLKLYPDGIVSIVSDTYNVYKVLTEFATKLKPQILSREGKVVFRPDSGNPEYIICGNPEAEEGSLEWKGAIRLLDEVFGHTINKQGLKLLNDKVGLIYGDGQYYERYERTLNKLIEMGYSPENLVIGVGGIMRNHSRDTLGFALKATYVEVNGEPIEIMKDPITDIGKKSLKGLMRLDYENNKFITKDQVSWEEESGGLLESFYHNGKIVKEYSFKEIRERVKNSLESK
jgi:nicotinamide phosphoribosyltransferase